MTDDELARRRMSPRDRLKAIASEQNAAGRDRLQEVLAEQRQRPGMPNAHKWQEALAEQKGQFKRHVRRDEAPTPKRITMALDLAGLYGPEVDRTLGVEEPTVDLWEAGLVIPTREQVYRLAQLTGWPWRFFYLPEPLAITSGFICGADGCQPLGGDKVEPSGQGGLF